MGVEINPSVVQILYLLTALLFILGLRSMGQADTARRGVVLAELGMLLAVVGTLLQHGVITYQWIAVGLVVGSTIGALMSVFIPMTKMPERIALSHAFGGVAVTLVGVAEYLKHSEAGFSLLQISATGAEVFLGALTVTGSLIAFGKLQGVVSGRPLTFRGQNGLNLVAIAGAIALWAWLIAHPMQSEIFYAVLGLGTALGISLVLPIGGADMPVVICLLNAYAGLAASATGFAIDNPILIICGALDGGSGFILGLMMSKAMNRSFRNVLFGAFGAASAETSSATSGSQQAIANEATVEDAAEVLAAARSVIVIPGYGMAVSQAQHAVRELALLIEKRGATVRYAIHPVAGRMPGHMNVLLAEANIPYDQLFDLDDINDDFAQTDVAIVVGANDVVNPAAKNNPGSPIYGMPVFNVEQAQTVMVLKRSLNPGFAGIENALFVEPNTMMVLGDAKKTLTSMVQTLKML